MLCTPRFVRLLLCLGWLATLLAAVPPAAAQTAAAPESGPTRPKVCLVLSGGGARGAAHIGVLKVLEEYRVPIHCIAGTSMGALVGAAYATGMTIPEMDQITGSITTELLFKEKPPREERAMRRKQDDYTILFGPDFGVADGTLKLPKGLVSGVQLETVLRQLTKVKGYHHFDQLPIPFRAVATDLVTGKAVVFAEGELANVMRASMSVPGAVAPAEFGGMVLVDGMLTRNLPVEIALQMKADVIIAVNVGTPLLKREELSGILGVAGQMISILTEQNVQTSLGLLGPEDILISPDLEGYTTADFDRLAQIAPLGETAARPLGERLARLSLPPQEYAALRQRQTVALAVDTRPVDEIRFEALKRVNPEAAMAQLETKTGQPIDQPTLDRDMRRLYGTDDFEHVNYRLIDEAGRSVLTVDAVEKSWGPDYLRFGLGLSSDFSGAAYFNLMASYRKTWLNSYGAEWRTDVQMGQVAGLGTEFYQPLDPRGAFFVAPSLLFERYATDLYSGDNRIAVYDIRSSRVGLALGMQFTRYGELRVGLMRGQREPELDTGAPVLALPADKIQLGGVTARLVMDQLNSAIFPRYGWRTVIHLFGSEQGLGADRNYTRWDVDGSWATSAGEHTFQLAGRFGGKIGSNPLPAHELFQWGGFMQQSGYKTGQLLGSSLQYGRLTYYRRLLRLPLLEGAYGGFSLELGKVGNPLVPGNPTGWLRSGSLFVGTDSPVGPLYLGYGHAEDGNQSMYLYLGLPF